MNSFRVPRRERLIEWGRGCSGSTSGVDNSLFWQSIGGKLFYIVDNENVDALHFARSSEMNHSCFSRGISRTASDSLLLIDNGKVAWLRMRALQFSLYRVFHITRDTNPAAVIIHKNCTNIPWSFFELKIFILKISRSAFSRLIACALKRPVQT